MGNATFAGGPNKGQDFGGGALSTANDEDAFLVSFDENGVHRWSKSLGGNGPRSTDIERIDGLAVDVRNQDLLLAGTFDDTIDLGGGDLISAGGSDIFVARFDASGNHRSSKTYGSSMHDELLGFAADTSGNTYLVGRYLGPIDFGGGALAVDRFDTFLASFDAAGAHRWSRRLVTSDTTPSLVVTTDGDGNVHIAGEFNEPVDLGGGVLRHVRVGDIFIVSYTPWGAHRFSLGLGSSGYDGGTSLVVGSGGHLFVAGTFSDTIAIGGHSITSTLFTDAFLLSLELQAEH
ncbi:MAG: hypothetical protein JRH20_20580 [Deltaproteobacteria bacterium]|nr:hypothetical protein [Deltaproteobacteria bacterium]